MQSILKIKNKIRKIFRSQGVLDYKIPFKMAINSSFDISRLRGCEKEPETVAWLEKTLTPDSVFYDVGANIGAYSLIASHFTNHIYAIEPSPATFATLCENIELNAVPLKITPIQCLLGEKDAIETLHFSSSESGAAEHSYTRGDTIQKIPMFKLDTLINLFSWDKPTHIKIDVDGVEMRVLQGIDLSSVQCLLIESEELEIIPYLQNKGFTLQNSYPRKKKGAFNYIFGK